MAKRGKKYQDVMKKMPTSLVSLEEAIAFVKANPLAKFDETMEMGMRMGVDTTKTDQVVRGTVNLPHGTGKTVKVVVFAQGAAADAATAAGADEVGMTELLEKVKGGWTDFDVAIATPEAMTEVRKLARVLGPRGLMPNPRTGTVTDDTGAAVKSSKAGKVEFRMDRTGNICVPFGKRSFSVEALAANAEALMGAIRAERPAAAKGQFIRSLTVCSTMGVGVGVTVKAEAVKE
ncbi:MAG: 50S ribosomal protein L1 [Kiritimatiellaeota bacterium]|nr:50S ribosomal protein L1 [Kiritimatiellota bacterium]